MNDSAINSGQVCLYWSSSDISLCTLLQKYPHKNHFFSIEIALLIVFVFRFFYWIDYKSCFWQCSMCKRLASVPLFKDSQPPLLCIRYWQYIAWRGDKIRNMRLCFYLLYYCSRRGGPFFVIDNHKTKHKKTQSQCPWTFQTWVIFPIDVWYSSSVLPVFLHCVYNSL